jgi:hypothetical protein
LVGCLKIYNIINGINKNHWILKAYLIISDNVLLFMSVPKKSRRNIVKKILPIVTSGMLNNLNHHESSAASVEL